MIRDGALAAAGLLVEQIGGPPVNTYDIPESFKPAAAGTGADLYRRSLYTFWRRTGPAPVLESFDVPKRVVCVAKRDITNTPLHAFVLGRPLRLQRQSGRHLPRRKMPPIQRRSQ
jgi:hypothetical protein